MSGTLRKKMNIPKCLFFLYTFTTCNFLTHYSISFNIVYKHLKAFLKRRKTFCCHQDEININECCCVHKFPHFLGSIFQIYGHNYLHLIYISYLQWNENSGKKKNSISFKKCIVAPHNTAKSGRNCQCRQGLPLSQGILLLIIHSIYCWLT